ncbi:MAG: hypothetical protein N0C88_15100 [Candidatus Thiodiazotropha lotti]|uniref:Uncharacterized protein n=1 Tax=Candidatus Thiodiazotropha lotti TaxID=2792787 RepID=A0A9E4N0Q5_9GAMM|nr:hypothetical protein [Candidatus Thiodiazotropha lotti]MCW4204630.1 hypothetical protein [Candidatus Thiodiazotropha lotti]
MSNEKEKIHIFDRQENVDRLLKGFYAICILLVVLDLVLHRHIGFAWEKLPAFYAVYGFVACVLLVVIAKKMRNVLMRGEDYYDE